ncbi:MAG: hypothetical protein QW404_01380 [Candidatus Nanoarchaeia archaeon]
MKRGFWFGFFLLLLFCSISVIAAETFTLNVGGSKEIKGVNFTLLRTNTKTEKIIMCVNNKKVIVDYKANLGNAAIRVKDVSERYAQIEVEVACGNKCECDSSCSNDACFSAGFSCSSDADCDDGNPETNDICSAGVCENRPVQLKSCSSNSDCDDNNPCTKDTCNKVIDKCIHEEVQGCSPFAEEPLPTEEKPQQPVMTKQVPFYKLSAYILLGIIVLLIIAVIIKRIIR